MLPHPEIDAPAQRAAVSAKRIGNVHRSRLGLLIARRSPELQLSEALALTLAMAPGLASRLLSRCCGVAQIEVDPSEMSVQTEFPLAERRRVDVAVQWGEEALLWIEVKRGMMGESSPDQVAGYARALKERHPDARHRAVAYISDLGASGPDPESIVEGVEYEKWTWRDLAHEEEMAPTIEPIVEDLIFYLREAGLAMTPITSEMVSAIERFAIAKASLTNILAEASSQIDCGVDREFLAVGDVHPRFDRWAVAWRDQTYAQHLFTGRLGELHQRALLEWNLRLRNVDAGYDDQPVFAAGLTWLDAEVAWQDVPTTSNALRNAVSHEGFREYDEDGLRRIYRFMPLSDLVHESDDARRQAEALARFVRGSYEYLLVALSGQQS